MRYTSKDVRVFVVVLYVIILISTHKKNNNHLQVCFFSSTWNILFRPSSDIFQLVFDLQHLNQMLRSAFIANMCTLTHYLTFSPRHMTCCVNTVTWFMLMVSQTLQTWQSCFLVTKALETSVWVYRVQNTRKVSKKFCFMADGVSLACRPQL